MKIVSSIEYIEIGDMNIVVPYFSSELLFFVGSLQNKRFPPNKLILWNFRIQELIGSVNLRENINYIKITKNIIFIQIEYKIILFDLKNLRYISTIHDVYNNDITKISVNEKFHDFDNDITLTYISNCYKNYIKIIKYKVKNNNLLLKSQSLVISQFKKIQHIYVSSNLITVTNGKGKKIHIYSLHDLNLKFCFWRGYNPSRILSLTIDEYEVYLCVLSTSFTFHIFSLDREKLNDSSLSINSLNVNRITENSHIFKSFFQNIFVINFLNRHHLRICILEVLQNLDFLRILMIID
jgi:hypothetical protein